MCLTAGHTFQNVVTQDTFECSTNRLVVVLASECKEHTEEQERLRRQASPRSIEV